LYHYALRKRELKQCNDLNRRYLGKAKLWGKKTGPYHPARAGCRRQGCGAPAGQRALGRDIQGHNLNNAKPYFLFFSKKTPKRGENHPRNP